MSTLGINVSKNTETVPTINRVQLTAAIQGDKNIQEIIRRMKVMYDASQNTPFRIADIALGGGSLVDVYLGRKPKDYDIFVGFHEDALNNLGTTLSNATEINPFLQSTNTLGEDQHVGTYKLGYQLAQSVFPTFREIGGMNLETGEYEDFEFVGEGFWGDMRVQLVTTYTLPKNRFDIYPCDLWVNQDGTIWGDALDSFVIRQRKNCQPSRRPWYRIWKYLVRGIPISHHYLNETPPPQLPIFNKIQSSEYAYFSAIAKAFDASRPDPDFGQFEPVDAALYAVLCDELPTDILVV